MLQRLGYDQVMQVETRERRFLYDLPHRISFPIIMKWVRSEKTKNDDLITYENRKTEKHSNR